MRGPADYLEEDIGESLDIVGRIPPPVVWEYIQKIIQNQLKEVLLLRLGENSWRNAQYHKSILICISSFSNMKPVSRDDDFSEAGFLVGPYHYELN